MDQQPFSFGPELLTNEEMARADRMTIEAGTASFTLMRRAARHVANAAREMLRENATRTGHVTVLCGPGNNGGDGFVAAQLLRNMGYRVSVVLLGDPDRLSADCRQARLYWTGDLTPFTFELIDHSDLVIDAIFGAGLTRPLEQNVLDIVGYLASARKPVLAVDLPSGINGSNGLDKDADYFEHVSADRTVTFFRLKPAHLLAESRLACGNISCHDIGIDPQTLADIQPATCANRPDVWQDQLPVPGVTTHKYERGHALLVSGPPAHTGAIRLAAHAALRIGAGLVTIASPSAALVEHAAQLTAIMLSPVDDAAQLTTMLQDDRITAVAIGPAAGVTAETRDCVLHCLRSPVATVLDADALTVFGAAHNGEPDTLFKSIHDRLPETDDADAPSYNVVLTPHEGEYSRIFPDVTGDKLSRARAAAQRSGAIVVLKGPDTIVAAPDGRTTINASAPPWLATAGSGDVLTGTITGLLAQGMPAFHAASAAVWMHGRAADRFGPGLIAEDIADQYPAVLQTDIQSTRHSEVHTVRSDHAS